MKVEKLKAELKRADVIGLSETDSNKNAEIVARTIYADFSHIPALNHGDVSYNL